MIDLNQLLPVTQRMDLGRAYMESGDLDRSAKVYESVLDLEPNNAKAACNAAAVYLQSKLPVMASEWSYRALGIDPLNQHAMRMIGDAAIQQRDWDKAKEWFHKSLCVDPDCRDTLTNTAYFCQLMGQPHEALRLYTRVRDLYPLDLTVRHWRSMTMLLMAKTQYDWDEALGEYEIRHILTHKTFDMSGSVMYTGQPSLLTSGNIVLVAEQGIGDAVMFVRYARYLKSRMSSHQKVYILCREAMVDLLKLVDGVDGVDSSVAELPEFYWHVPMMSLLKTEGWPTYKPDNSPYLGKELDPTFRPVHRNIGICWKGNPEHDNDKYRSVSIETLIKAFQGVDGVILHSLQQSKYNAGLPGKLHTPDINTLVTLARQIRSMDLIVTVDTAVLHIAGSMGVPCFALIPSNPDWRWGTEGETTPWYPSVRLFRATEPLNWEEPLKRMNAAIKEICK